MAKGMGLASALAKMKKTHNKDMARMKKHRAKAMKSIRKHRGY